MLRRSVFNSIWLLVSVALVGCSSSKEPEVEPAPAAPQAGSKPPEVVKSFYVAPDLGPPPLSKPAVPVLALFDLKVEPVMLALAQGSKGTITITATRKDYKGPIVIELSNLPVQVTAAKATILPDKDSVALEVSAAANAALGDKRDVTVLATAPDAENKTITSSPITISISAAKPASTSIASAPFDLSIGPGPVNIVQGGNARLRVTVTRKSYDGPIVVELTNLPSGVTAPKATILAGKTAVDVQVRAAVNAMVARTTNVTALAMTTDTVKRSVVSAPFTLNVTATAKPSRPTFSLRADPALLHLTAGSTGRLHVTLARKGYGGGVTVELSNLPRGVTAGRLTIPAGQDSGDLVVNAAGNAALGDGGNVVVRGAAGTADSLITASAAIAIRVTAAPKSPPAPIPSFALRVQPGTIKLKQGGKARIKVIADRSGGYQGTIMVVLRHLPAHVTAPKATIAPGQATVEIELHAAPNASLGKHGGVQAAGTAPAPVALRTSPGFTINVVRR
jgi:hypothetical protein